MVVTRSALTMMPDPTAWAGARPLSSQLALGATRYVPVQGGSCASNDESFGARFPPKPPGRPAPPPRGLPVRRELRRVRGAMTDAADRPLHDTRQRFLVKGDLSRLIDVLKFDPDQPRVPAGSAEAEWFAPAVPAVVLPAPAVLLKPPRGHAPLPR
jgi:hypothetical protein